MSIVEERLPVEGKTPIEAAVYTGFAEYMGWRTGDVVEFLESKLKIKSLEDAIKDELIRLGAGSEIR